MARISWDNGIALFFHDVPDGDGPGGTMTGDGSIGPPTGALTGDPANWENNERGKGVRVWNEGSNSSGNDVGTKPFTAPQGMTPGDTVTYRHDAFTWEKSAEFLGYYVLPGSGPAFDRTYLVLWDEDVYGGRFVLIGANPSDEDLATLLSNFNSESDIVKENFAVCFLPGTLIATPSGDRRVEDLVPGDPVLVEDVSSVQATWLGRIGRGLRRRLGYGRAVPVKWLGRQTVSTRFGPAERLMPVRFAAGSLGGGGGQPLLPHSDLTVTADHAMLVDGVLCEAGALVNEMTITRIPLSEFGESYTVYHVETEDHEIILANGAPAETFIDNISRRAFDNYAEFEKLHGDQPEMNELPHPRASNARHLPARIRKRLGIGAERESAA